MIICKMDYNEKDLIINKFKEENDKLRKELAQLEDNLIVTKAEYRYEVSRADKLKVENEGLKKELKGLHEHLATRIEIEEYRDKGVKE